MRLSSQDQGIQKFLNQIADEIENIERTYNMRVGGNDYRLFIEHYQDIVRHVLNHKCASTSDKNHHLNTISSEMNRLKHHTHWVGGGAHVFLHAHNIKSAISKKREWLENPASLIIPDDAVELHINNFTHMFQPQKTYDNLQKVLNYRHAEIPRSQEWRNYDAKQFWKNIITAINDTHKAAKASDSVRKKYMQNLKYFWIQITHPLLLVQCVQNNKFVPEAYLPESKLYQMDADSLKLGDLYSSYSVLFAALMREPADRNFKDIVTSLDEMVSEASDLKQMIIQLLEQGGLELEDLNEIVGQCNSEELKHMLMIMLHEISQKKEQKKLSSIESAKLSSNLNEIMLGADNAIAASDKAHTKFLGAQLQVYQENLDLVKKLAGQGVNIAGKFAAQAAEAQRGRGGNTRAR